MNEETFNQLNTAGKRMFPITTQDDSGAVAQVLPERLLDLLVRLEQAEAECVRLRAENAALRRELLTEQLNFNPQASRFSEPT